MKLKEWVEKWLKEYANGSVKENTYRRYCQTIRTQILPYLGEYELGDITSSVLQKYVFELMSKGNKLTGKGLSSSFVNLILTLLKNMLKTAYYLGLINKFDFDNVRRPEQKSKKVECFTLKEQRMIERYVHEKNSRKLYGIVLCLYTGLRIGELLALTWGDVDFKQKVIFVNKTCYDCYAGGESMHLVSEPKTSNSVRVIPIPNNVENRLREMRRKHRSERVICSDRGETVSIRNYQKCFASVLRKLEIPHKGFHALRHTFATRAIECGMDVKCLADILGHKNPTVTLNRYTHSLIEHKRKMMDIMSDMMS